MSTNENAPAGNRGASINPTNTESTPRPEDILAAAHTYCVLVESAHGKYRRRLYLSLSAAEKAVQRAKANGKYAALVLAVVTPQAVIQ